MTRTHAQVYAGKGVGVRLKVAKTVVRKGSELRVGSAGEACRSAKAGWPPKR